MDINKLQSSIDAYLIAGERGHYQLPTSIDLKPYGEHGCSANTGILDHHYERLQLFISGSNGQYVISDHGYIRREIYHLGDDSEPHLLGHGTDELIAGHLDYEHNRHLSEANGQIICSANDEDFAEKLTGFIGLLWQITEEISRYLRPWDYYTYDGDGQGDEDDDQYAYGDDSETLLNGTQFYYDGQALTGSELIDRLPQSPALRKAYERFCDLRYEGLLEGMTAREASVRAQTLVDAELATRK